MSSCSFGRCPSVDAPAQALQLRGRCRASVRTARQPTPSRPGVGGLGSRPYASVAKHLPDFGRTLVRHTCGPHFCTILDGVAWHSIAWHGVACIAWHGMAWHSIAWHGVACIAWHGMAWHSIAWHGVACIAWHGMAGHSIVWHGVACIAWHGMAWRGIASHGMA
eukprot:363973-Chlamydomonas_euryale.AAC.2